MRCPAHGGGAPEIFRTKLIVLEGFLITMILNISSDYFDRYLVTYGTDKISVLPKFTIPLVLLNFWTLGRNHPPAHHFSLPSTRYLTVEKTKIHAFDSGQSPNYGSMPPPQRYSPLAPVSHHKALTSDTAEPILNDTLCHMRHTAFFLQSCAIQNTCVPAFGRRIFHPRA